MGSTYLAPKKQKRRQVRTHLVHRYTIVDGLAELWTRRETCYKETREKVMYGHKNELIKT